MLFKSSFSLIFFYLILKVSNKCGDYIIETGEACDDGNTISDDGCSNDCLIEDNYKCYNNSQQYSVCYISKPFSADLHLVSTNPFELNLIFTKPFLKYDPEFIKLRIIMTISGLKIFEDFSWNLESSSNDKEFKLFIYFNSNISFVSKKAVINFNNSDGAIIDIYNESLGIGSQTLSVILPIYINYSQIEENFMIFMEYFISFVFFSMLFCFIPLSILNALTVFWSFLGSLFLNN